jgi:hypothetical protein
MTRAGPSARPDHRQRRLGLERYTVFLAWLFMSCSRANIAP